jgi:putative Holliday junction resolvase
MFTNLVGALFVVGHEGLEMDADVVGMGVEIVERMEEVARGEVTTIADELGIEAEVEGNAAPFRRVVEDWDPELLLCGLPLTLAGEEGPQAQRIRGIAQRVSAQARLPLEYVDERLTSSEAKQILRRQGLNEKSMRGKVDMVAASLMLQAWLDSRRVDTRED